jgi:hypothetical protein
VDQLKSITTQQYHGWGQAQIYALSAAQLHALPFVTPLVLDLNGDGVHTSAMKAGGVRFDLGASGSAQATGWIADGDGLLALDRNHDGLINNGSELFGSATPLGNGNTAQEGYQALASMDSNHDGRINADDAQWADLRVWVDANADGVSQPGELKTRAALGITQLNLDVQQGGSWDNGNFIGQTSTYQTADGASHEVADVWFAQGSSLSDQVSGLAQSLAAYAHGDHGNSHGKGALALPDMAARHAGPSGSGALAAASARLADQLHQFDAHGKLSAAAGDSAAELRLRAQHQAASQGWLAAR